MSQNATDSVVLELRKLTVEYLVRGETIPAAKDINLVLRRGEGFGLLGGSGAGKSTVALACLGFLPENALISSGQVLFGGRNMAEMAHREVRALWGKRIALVPQDPHSALNPSRRVGKQLADVIRSGGRIPAAETRTRISRLLDLVRLPNANRIMESYPHQLSGGMKQRICIARALATSPEILVLDEPTTALDVTTQASILDTIRDIRDELQVALLYITHDLRVVDSLCNEIGVMDRGSLIEQGETQQLLRRPQHPFTRALVEAAYNIRPNASAHTQHEDGASQPEPEFVSVDGLRKTYYTGGALGRRHAVEAVNDVSLSISAGKTTALVGESGSGKSSVGACLIGLTSPSSGTITLRGRTLSGLSVDRTQEQRQAMAIVFQNPNASLNPSHSVQRILYRALPREKRTPAEVRRLLCSVQLDPDLAGRLPRELSGGQKQRVAIARAFASNPQLVILDEATSSLDLTVQFAILQMLKQLQNENGTAYIFISHDMHVVNYLADDVAIMCKGTICERGNVSQIYSNPQHEYTRELLTSAGITLR